MIKINPARLLDDLEALRRIGGAGTGVVREAFTPTDLEGRRWLAQRFAEAGLRPVWDPIGNLFGLPSSDRPAILLGSHSDTQPEGGWLDGSYGVICGLEVARAAREAGLDGVAVVSFADEEGTFEPLMGSRIWTGELPLAAVHDRRDRNGRRLADVLAGVPELREAQRVPPQRFSGYIEAHIEQGPILHEADEPVGVVGTIVGMQHVEIEILGDQNHAGTTPMNRRHDAVMGFVALAHAINESFRSEAGPTTVWTFGRVNVTPNATSIVPGRVDAMLQIRDPDQARLDRFSARARAIAEDLGARGPVRIATRVVAELPPAPMDAALVGRLSDAAESLVPGRWRPMTSGALHDAAPASRVLPSAMLFVPSIAGKSHCFEEDTRSEDLVQGCAVLGAAVGQLLAEHA